MTNEEAIKILRHWGSNTPAFDRDCAVKMAIEALEKSEPCEDAVSRKAVKDGFVEMCSLICPYTEKQRHAMCGSCLLGTAFDVLEATQSVTPKQRWIPVIERLPEKQTKVLVVDFGEVDTAYLNSEGRWRDFHGNKLKDVKAWMPLPKWEGDVE